MTGLSYTATTETVHGLLRLEGPDVTVQWRVARKTEEMKGDGYHTDEELEQGWRSRRMHSPRRMPNKRCWRSRRNPASSLRVVSTGCLGQPRYIRPRSLRCSGKRLHRRVHRVHRSRQRRSRFQRLDGLHDPLAVGAAFPETAQHLPKAR